MFAEALVALPGGIHVGARYEFARLWHDRAHRDTFLPQRAATLGDLVRSKTVVLIILAILAFLQGAAGQFFYPGQVFSRSDIIFSLVGLALIFAWYRIDAEERNYQRSIDLNIAIVAVTIIAFPYYFFRSRGARRGLIALAKAFVFCVVMQVLATGGAYAIYYVLQV